jgi:RNA polymerase sigma factor (sigma-70 family)
MTMRNWKRITDEEKERVEENMGLVWDVVLGRFRAYCPRHQHDMAQEGTFGLMDAARRYSPEMGVRFATFAYPAVRGAILDALPRIVDSAVVVTKGAWECATRGKTSESWTPTPETIAAAQRACGPRGHLAEDSKWAEDEGPRRVDSEDSHRVLRSVLEELPERHRDLLARRYGIGETGHQTERDIARGLGITHQAVHQIETRAREAIHKMFVLRGLTEDHLI